MTRTGRVVLERAAQQLADATSRPPYAFQLPPVQGRQLLDEAQSNPTVPKPLVTDEWIQVQGGPTGIVAVRIIKPADARGHLPVIFYLHGAGWVFGGAHTHDRLVRELATRSHAAVVFPEYDRAPEARYPTAIEQAFVVAQWVSEYGGEKHLDASRMAVAGDSVGGNMAIALSLMAQERGGVRLAGQLLCYPVTDAGLDTASYHEFAEGYSLRRDAMKWYWDQYTSNPQQRAEVTASPLRATLDQLRSLPPTMVLTAEADVLRDEGEAFAARLREAGVPVTAVRFGGIIHDFMMLDALRDTEANRAALELASAFLREVLGTGHWPETPETWPVDG